MIKLPVFLSLDNDGTTINANQDYSVTPGRFQVKADVATLRPKELIIQIDDTDSFLNTFGNLPELTNGVQVLLEKSDGAGGWTTIQDLTAGTPIKKTLDGFHLGCEMVPGQNGATTPGTTMRFKLDDRLEMEPDNLTYLTVLLNDDLSALINLSFCLI